MSNEQIKVAEVAPEKIPGPKAKEVITRPGEEADATADRLHDEAVATGTQYAADAATNFDKNARDIAKKSGVQLG